ncbi:DUF4365 domain-containing protein [Streptosporangium sp. DT93]|uniref:DUF4365 domain-containing protein n=1 Tax=Streptosporangium sp. DT93 TaxID=3393428 RepID=UPI003CED3F1A
MRVDASVHVERAGVAALAKAAHERLGWLCREQPVVDFGVDAILELVENGHTAGRLLGAQIKSGTSWFDEPTRDGWTFRFNDEHAQYWFDYDIPVVIVLHDPVSGTLYWQSLSHNTAESTGKDWKVTVPAEQQINEISIAALTRLARPAREGGDPAEQRFVRWLDRLPGEARDRLERTRRRALQDGDAVAARAIERLADLLQGDLPTETVSALLTKAPAWWPADEWGWQLWASVADYANEHLLEPQAAACFNRAVAAGATPASRWRAFAGLSLIHSDPAQATSILIEAATSPDGRLLADLGLALLEREKIGGRGPLALPASLAEAIEDGRVRSEGTALRFLADQAKAHHDLDLAVAWLETLVSVFPRSNSGRIALARALAQRASQGTSPLHEGDLARARKLADSARAEQRRWGGPSEHPAYVLFHVHLLTGDLDAAITVALPEPHGQANAREAAAEQLAQAAARVALQLGHPQADDLVAKVSSPVGVAVLNACRADVQAAEPSDLIALWNHVVELADGDALEERMIAFRALAELGVWPLPGLEDLLARKVVTDEESSTLHARADIAQGHHQAGLMRLRQLADRSLSGAAALAQSLVELERHTEAVHACDRAAARFGDIEFLQRALRILQRTGQHNEWRHRALLVLSRPSLPQAVRGPLRRELLDDAFNRQDWTTVEQHAVAALTESDTPGAPEETVLEAGTRTRPLTIEQVGYAWSLIGARWFARQPDVALRAYTALLPPVLTLVQAQLKAAVLPRMGWSSDTVQELLDLVERFAQHTRFTGQVLSAILLATGEPPHEDEAPPNTPLSALALPPVLSTRLQAALETQLRLNPDGPLRPVDPQKITDPETLSRMLEPRARLAQHLRGQVLASVIPLGLLASQLNRPYALALLQRAAGCIPAGEADPERFDAEVAAVQAALDQVVVLDTSTLYMATLTSAGFAELRARFASVHLPSPCHDDLMMTTTAIEQVRKSSMNIGVEPGFGLRVSQLTQQDRDHLNDRMQHLVKAAELTDIVPVADLTLVTELMTGGLDPNLVTQSPTFTAQREGAWLAAVQLALETGAPLWSDDVVLRALTAGADIPTFGTLALLHVLYDQGLADTTDDDHRRFLADYVVDLPLHQELLRRQAQADGWQPRSAAVPFTRPAAWREPHETLDTFLTLIREVHRHEPQAVAGWLLCGICGFAGAVHPHEVPVRAARLTCLVAEQTVGLTRQGLSELVQSAEAGLRQARELGEIRASLAEETTQADDSDDPEALRVHITAVLVETHQGQAQVENEADSITRKAEDFVKSAYALAETRQENHHHTA